MIECEHGTAEIKLDDKTWDFPNIEVNSIDWGRRSVTVSFTAYLASEGEGPYYVKVKSNDEVEYAVIKFWDEVYRKVKVGYFVIDDNGKVYEVGGPNVLFPYDADDMQVYTPEDVIPTTALRAVESVAVDPPQKFTEWTLCKVRDVGNVGSSYAEVKGSNYRLGPGCPEYALYGIEILEVIKVVE